MGDLVSCSVANHFNWMFLNSISFLKYFCSEIFSNHRHSGMLVAAVFPITPSRSPQTEDLGQVHPVPSDIK